jgi:Icc protein
LLRVLHLTDPHLFANPEGALRGTVTHASLGAVLDHYRQSDWEADLVVVTGDLIHDDSAKAYDHFRGLLGDTGLPVYCLPGNHDVRGLMRAALSTPPFHYCASIEASNWLIVCLDSCVEGSAGGFLDKAEAERLGTEIEASAAEHVLVCLHHPLIPTGSAWLDSVGLENAGEALDQIAAHSGVRLCIFGHVHQDLEEQHRGVRLLATPSTCRQFRPRSEKFGVDGKPPAYRRINLRADGSFDHELVWVDHAAGSNARRSDEPVF